MSSTIYFMVPLAGCRGNAFTFPQSRSVYFSKTGQFPTFSDPSFFAINSLNCIIFPIVVLFLLSCDLGEKVFVDKKEGCIPR